MPIGIDRRMGQLLRSTTTRKAPLPIISKRVNSSWIDTIKFNPNNDKMAFRLRGGRNYVYVKANPTMFNSWVHAGSKGKWWWAYLRNRTSKKWGIGPTALHNKMNAVSPLQRRWP